MVGSDVYIGIQARSTSTRFPGKIFEKIGDKSILQHVIEACKNSAVYINRTSFKNGILVKTVVLCPHGDPLTSEFKDVVKVFEGDENDVLSRYAEMTEKMNADYVVRITSDCPLIPSFLITKAINTAVINKYDYCSNVDEDSRTAVDGFDVEVISKKAMAWLHKNASLPADREHVTTMFRREPPKWAKVGYIVGYLDQSGLKLSVDTPEDLERVRKEYQKILDAITKAEEAHGPSCVHRF
jgi:spore coat polysaccharide biosynthesis protein SpsF